MKFRAQTAKQATLDPVFDKKFSFSVRQYYYHANLLIWYSVEREVEGNSN